MEFEKLVQEFANKATLVDAAGVPFIKKDEEIYDADLEHEKIMSLLAQYEAEIEQYILQAEHPQ
jgi:hypothetical protein